MITTHGRRLAATAGAVALALSTLTPATAFGGGTPDAATARAATDGRIAFVDFGSGVLDTVNPDGSALQQVTDPATEGFVNGRAAWTPDGSHLFYSASRNGGDFKIYEIATDGTGRRLAVPDGPGFFDFLPEVTPDGRWVLFDRCRPDPPGGCAIFAARAQGPRRHLHAVVPYGPPRKDVFTGYFAISPNGRRLAFTRGGFRGITQQVWVSSIDGSHAHPVSRPSDEPAATSWSDNQTLVVTSPNAHLGAHLYTMPANGGRLRLLSAGPFPHADFFGDACPSGAQVTFLADEDFPDLAGNHLYIVNTDGTGRHQVDVGTDTVGPAVWGSAPLLPAAASTPPGQRASSLSAQQVRRVEARIPGYLRGHRMVR